MTENRERSYIILAGIVALGVVLRLAFIADEGFWFDEFWIWRQVRMGFGALIDDMVRGDVHPPLYQIVMWLWARVAGTGELALRLPSAVFGVVAIVLVWRLGRQLFGEGAGLWAAAIVATSEFAVYYSQEARSYSMLLMFSAAAATMWVSTVRDGRARYLVGFVLTGMATIYSHVFGGVFMAYLALAWLVLRLRGRHGELTTTRAVGSYVAMALAFAPWLPAMMGQAARVQEGFWIPVPKAYFWVTYFAKYVGQPILAGVAALVIGYGIWRVMGHPRDDDVAGAKRSDDAPAGSRPLTPREAVIWALGCFFFMLGLPYLVSLVSQPVMHDKSAIAALVPIAVLGGVGLSRMPLRARIGVAVVWAGLSLYAIVFTNYLTQNREAWREMSVTVADAYQEGDMVVLYHPDFDYMFCYHYYLPDHVRTFEMICDGEACDEPAAALHAITEQSGVDRLWLLRVRASDAYPHQLGDYWTVVESRQFNNGVLDELRPR